MLKTVSEPDKSAATDSPITSTVQAKPTKSAKRGSLLAQASALVAVPLLFNVIWMILFWNGFVSESKLSEQQLAERRLLSDLNKMTVSFYECSDDSVMRAITGRIVWEKVAVEHLANFHELYSKLIVNSLLNDGQKKILTEANEFLNYTVSESSKQTDIEFRAESFESRRGYVKSLGRKAVGRALWLNGLFEPQEANLARLERANDQSRNQMLWIAISGLAVNLLITLLFGLFVRRNFKNRLQLLVHHARQLGSRSTIESALPGNDELTVVDKAMRESASELEKVFSFKRTVTEMMAHDLRSPLTSAMASIETVLARSTNLSETEKVRLEAAQSGVLRSAALVDDLLVLDSLETGEMSLTKTTIDIHEVIEQSAEVLQGSATAKGITVVYNGESRLVDADPKRIGQVLTNLISNAIKFSPKNSQVIVEQKEEPGELRISVRDFGTGIKAEELEKVFEKYFRSDKHREVVGTGLGLAICKMIVEAHQGRIGCLSNNGAVFWFTIPTSPVTEEE